VSAADRRPILASRRVELGAPGQTLLAELLQARSGRVVCRLAVEIVRDGELLETASFSLSPGDLLAVAGALTSLAKDAVAPTRKAAA
jgi:hypothetical protein